MWEARLWWWSRAIEIAAALACVIADRIPFNRQPVSRETLLKSLPLYVPWKGD